MRILLVNNFFYLRGGSERIFFNEIELLTKHGHEVAPFTRHFINNYPSEYSRFFAGPLEYENVSVFKKILSGLKTVYSFECLKKFGNLLDYYKPDLVHAHNIYGRLTTSVIDAARERHIPMVMTLHDYKLICPSYLMLNKGNICESCKGRNFHFCILKRCHKDSLLASTIYTVESYFNRILKKYAWVKYFVCPSQFSLLKHAECGIPMGKLIHIPNFIDISRYEPAFQGNKYILFVGRISREKGILTLLKAVKDIDVIVKIVGDGPMRLEYETYAKEHKINNVIFEGYKAGGELENLFRDALFIIVPSEWYEIFGMVIMESFAYGKPVIGSSIGGIPEMIKANETGLLFEPGNHEELREKIKYLLANPSLVAEMGKKAREKAEREFNADIHYKRLMEVYQKAL